MLRWIIVLIVGDILASARDYMFFLTSERVGKAIRGDFFQTILKKDIAFYDDRKVGDLCK